MLLDQKLIPAEGELVVPDRSATAYNLFQEPWWLDAVAAGEWEEVSVKRGGQVVARWPFVRRQRLGTTWLMQPKLTPYLGPWLRASDGKLANRIVDEKELMEELIDELPKFDVFRQCFSPEVTYWLPFYWRGFSQTTRYTYRLSDLTNVSNLWNGLQHNTRRVVRKAQKRVIVRNDLGIDAIARMWSYTFARQRADVPVPTEVLYRIDDACQKRACRKMFFAEDARGRIHAAVWVVWSNDCAYYLMGGGDPELRDSGAGTLVLWEAITFAATVTRQFDFEGSMLAPIERFFRSFGGMPISYFALTKLSRPIGFVAGLYRSGSALLGRIPVI